jgi:ribose 5-phosphate isomerase
MPDSHAVLAGPVVTDNGNFIIDAPFDREKMIDPYIVRNLSAVSLQKI